MAQINREVAAVRRQEKKLTTFPLKILHVKPFFCICLPPWRGVGVDTMMSIGLKKESENGRSERWRRHNSANCMQQDKPRIDAVDFV